MKITRVNRFAFLLMRKLLFLRSSQPPWAWNSSGIYSSCVSLVFQVLVAVSLGWVWANLAADYHLVRAGGPVNYSHSDWQLQGYDPNFNVLCFLCIILALGVKTTFMYVGQEKLRARPGWAFYVAVLLLLIVIWLAFLRHAQLNPPDYPLFITDSFLFMLVWTLFSVILFPALEISIRKK